MHSASHGTHVSVGQGRFELTFHRPKWLSAKTCCLDPVARWALSLLDGDQLPRLIRYHILPQFAFIPAILPCEIARPGPDGPKSGTGICFPSTLAMLISDHKLNICAN